MTALQTFCDLKARGFKMQASGETLLINPSELLNDSDVAAIRFHKFDLIQLLSRQSMSETGIPLSNQNLRKPKILDKWHSRNIRLWLGTTTKDGIEYRTLEYEADKPIPSKWLKELESEKHDIQLALVAQEVRDLSARYWESRNEEVEAARIEKAQYPEAFEHRPIDWQQIEQDRAMQDALATKLGPLKAIQAILRATNEILSLWIAKARKESPETIQRAALELLCIRHEIIVANLAETETPDSVKPGKQFTAATSGTAPSPVPNEETAAESLMLSF